MAGFVRFIRFEDYIRDYTKRFEALESYTLGVLVLGAKQQKTKRRIERNEMPGRRLWRK